jgi:hypothetical protein
MPGSPEPGDRAKAIAVELDGLGDAADPHIDGGARHAPVGGSAL